MNTAVQVIVFICYLLLFRNNISIGGFLRLLTGFLLPRCSAISTVVAAGVALGADVVLVTRSGLAIASSAPTLWLLAIAIPILVTRTTSPPTCRLFSGGALLLPPTCRLFSGGALLLPPTWRLFAIPLSRTTSAPTRRLLSVGGVAQIKIIDCLKN